MTSKNRGYKVEWLASSKPSPIHYIDRELLSNFTCVLGKGAFGTVELRHFHGYLVAVKKFNQTTCSKSDVLKEASIMAELSHNNLPFLFGICVEKRPFYLVSQFCEIGGNSLTVRDAQQKQECSAFPWFNLMLHSAGALEYMHDAGFCSMTLKVTIFC